MLELPCNQIYVTVNANPQKMHFHNFKLDSITLMLGGKLIKPYMTFILQDKEFLFYVKVFTVKAEDNIAVINVQTSDKVKEEIFNLVFKRNEKLND